MFAWVVAQIPRHGVDMGCNLLIPNQRASLERGERMLVELYNFLSFLRFGLLHHNLLAYRGLSKNLDPYDMT